MFASSFSNIIAHIPGFSKKEIEPEKRSIWQAREPGVWAGKVDEQRGSILLQLPAEIRNEIYEYVFSWNEVPVEGGRKDSGDRSNVDKGETGVKPLPCPLSLLAACRKINQEADLMAFRLHRFHILNAPPFHALLRRTAILTPPQLYSITSIALGLSDNSWALCDRTSSSIISSAIVILPNVTSIEVRADTVRRKVQFPYGFVESCEKHVPQWFVATLDLMVEGRSYRWQKGETWEWTFPNRHADPDYCREYNLTENMCDGTCAALLTQATGRQVWVSLAYKPNLDCWPHKDLSKFEVQLVPGTAEQLPVETVDTVHGADGLMYDPGQEYWDGVKERRLQKSAKKSLWG